MANAGEHQRNVPYFSTSVFLLVCFLSPFFPLSSYVHAGVHGRGRVGGGGGGGGTARSAGLWEAGGANAAALFKVLVGVLKRELAALQVVRDLKVAGARNLVVVVGLVRHDLVHRLLGRSK